MRVCLFYPLTLKTLWGCPSYKLATTMSYFFIWSFISPNTIFIHSNYCYITCNTKNLFSFPHWVMTSFWKTYSRAIQYVINKPQTLFYVFALKDMSFHLCFTFDLAFLDGNLTSFCLFPLLTSYFYFFIELNEYKWKKKLIIMFKP